MRTQTSLGWIAGLVLATSALAATLTERVSGDAVLSLKTGETAYASIDVGRAGEKSWSDFYFQIEASKFQEGIQFRALSIDSLKIAPGMAYMEGVGLIGNGKWPGNKTPFSLTILDFAKETDLFVLTIFGAKNNSIQFNGSVIKGDFFVTVTE